MSRRDPDHDLLTPVIGSAEHILTHSLAAPIHLYDPLPLGGDRLRSALFRCFIQDGPSNAPRSVILKTTRAGNDLPETGEGTTARARQAFLIEMAAIEFLNTLPLDPPAAPTLYGADQRMQILVLEDLGDGTSLADLLIGSDSEAAVRGLNAYARTLGRLHAATVGHERAYDSIRQGTAETSTRAWTSIGDLATADLPQFAAACASLGIALDAPFEQQIQVVSRSIECPGPFLSFNVSDACPDNHFVIEDTVRFFDFEFAGFGHALLDGSYLRLPFPTCWCVGRLPPQVQKQAEEIYRAELIQGCPPAADDSTFERAMLSACVYWTIRSVSWSLQRTLEQDDQWGLASHRQRHVYRLETLARQTEESGSLEAIGHVAAQLAHTLRKRWPTPDIDLLVYPAFQ